jgi:hypothetical protein
MLLLHNLAYPSEVHHRSGDIYNIIRCFESANSNQKWYKKRSYSFIYLGKGIKKKAVESEKGALIW